VSEKTREEGRPDALGSHQKVPWLRPSKGKEGDMVVMRLPMEYNFLVERLCKGKGKVHHCVRK
jgi:hypothetical protein